ncbi:MAG: hypothetical protein JF595_13070 [Sphingomonadales bacterium]|nr:hypothetical protein [Sphingomonadales bacterium]
MRYFLDAEYNGFGGELIALALVPEDEGAPSFYAAVECAAPTSWVVEHILPVLQTEPLSRAELADRFAGYLIDDQNPLLVADWPEDIAHAARLLVTGPGRMKPIRSIRFELVDPVLIGPIPPGETPHNARSDAAALRAAVLDYESRMAR